jgi:hypothetical protein
MTTRLGKITCFGCGDQGHLERDCPNSGIDGNGKPPWCGICDERTRQIDTGHGMARCQQCHPLRRKPLTSDRRCPACRQLIYEWDNAQCGNHSGPGITNRKPEREHIDTVIAAAKG